MPEPVQLSDGRTVAIRAIGPDDGDRLTAFHAQLSPESIRRRYFMAHPRLSAKELHRFTHVDGDTRLALVALDGDEIVGVGRYESLPGTATVEVAFVVRDDYQHLGLGGHLVELVAAAAARHGKTLLVAEILPENVAMRRAFHHAGPVDCSFSNGVMEITIPLTATGSGAAEPLP